VLRAAVAVKSLPEFVTNLEQPASFARPARAPDGRVGDEEGEAIRAERAEAREHGSTEAPTKYATGRRAVSRRP
ncbi:MAG: hypothetical protein R3D25_23495, partial [Geminicoccaceae bacterium]